MNQAVIDRVNEVITPVLKEKGIDLVETAYRQVGRQMILSILVYRPEGITLEECGALNGEVGAVLDQNDTIATSYVLEVSSPGLDRPLTTGQDFKRVIGKKMDVFLKEHFNDKLQYFGTLKAVEEDSIALETKTGLIKIPLDVINKGKLQINIRKERVK